VLNELPYRVPQKVYRPVDELQTDLDGWIREYNEARPHQGRWCFGKTPMQIFLDAMPQDETGAKTRRPAETGPVFREPSVKVTDVTH
jgi:hypothetical protein